MSDTAAVDGVPEDIDHSEPVHLLLVDEPEPPLCGARLFSPATSSRREATECDEGQEHERQEVASHGTSSPHGLFRDFTMDSPWLIPLFVRVFINFLSAHINVGCFARRMTSGPTEIALIYQYLFKRYGCMRVISVFL